MFLKICSVCGNEFYVDKKHNNDFVKYCKDCRATMQRMKVYAKRKKKPAEVNTGELEWLIHWACNASTREFRPLSGYWMMGG